jgi:hypothetical protein
MKTLNKIQSIQIKGSSLGPILMMGALLPLALFPAAVEVTYALRKIKTRKIKINS